MSVKIYRKFGYTIINVKDLRASLPTLTGGVKVHRSYVSTLIQNLCTKYPANQSYKEITLGPTLAIVVYTRTKDETYITWRNGSNRGSGNIRSYNLNTHETWGCTTWESAIASVYFRICPIEALPPHINFFEHLDPKVVKLYKKRLAGG